MSYNYKNTSSKLEELRASYKKEKEGFTYLQNIMNQTQPLYRQIAKVKEEECNKRVIINHDPIYKDTPIFYLKSPLSDYTENWNIITEQQINLFELIQDKCTSIYLNSSVPEPPCDNIQKAMIKLSHEVDATRKLSSNDFNIDIKENRIANNILNNWHIIFQSQNLLSTNGNYRQISSEANYIEVLSKEKSKKYLDLYQDSSQIITSKNERN